MGEVKTVKDMVLEFGLPESLAGPLSDLCSAAQANAVEVIGKGLDNGDLSDAMQAIQRVMDTVGMTRVALLSVGIHETCADRIGKGFKNEVTEKATKLAVEFGRALLELNDMLTMNVPTELLDRVKAAHSKSEEKDGEEGEGNDADCAAPAPTAEDVE